MIQATKRTYLVTRTDHVLGDPCTFDAVLVEDSTRTFGDDANSKLRCELHLSWILDPQKEFPAPVEAILTAYRSRRPLTVIEWTDGTMRIEVRP